jgi:hypothetical protein
MKVAFSLLKFEAKRTNPTKLLKKKRKPILKPLKFMALGTIKEKITQPRGLAQLV